MGFNIKGGFKGKPKNKIGLDIGSSSVKILEISRQGASPSIVSIGMKKVTGSARQDLVDAIKSLVEETKPRTTEANISVSGASVSVRFVTMPKMRDEELKSAIRFEAEKYIPFAIKDCIVDYQILRKNDKDNKVDVVLVAVKKDLVLDRISLIEECGLSVGVIDVDTFAVVNAYLENFPQEDPDKTVALLNIGSRFTNVGIVRGGSVRFVRDIAIGGYDFDQALAAAFNIDVKGIEEIKITPRDRMAEVMTYTRSIAGSLLDEVRLSFSYYENQSGQGINEICICGGSANLAGLGLSFEEAFEAQPHFLNPLRFLEKAKDLDSEFIEREKASFAVAAGLALRY